MAAFKEYEYGFYGIVGAFAVKWWDIGVCYYYLRADETRTECAYCQGRRTLLKQIPKIKNVVFISGDYREV